MSLSADSREPNADGRYPFLRSESKTILRPTVVGFRPNEQTQRKSQCLQESNQNRSPNP